MENLLQQGNVNVPSDKSKLTLYGVNTSGTPQDGKFTADELLGDVNDLTGSNVAVQLVFLDVDFSTGTELQQLGIALDSKPQFLVQPNKFLVFRTNRQEFLSDGNVRITTTDYYVRGRVPTDSDGNAYLGVNHPVGGIFSPFFFRFERLEQKITLIDNSTTPTNYALIDLGDIGTSDVHIAFNSDSNAVLTNELLIVEAVQDGEARQWLYVGDGETTPVTADDFRLLPNDASDSDPVDPTPNSETTPTSALSVSDANPVTLDNWEGKVTQLNGAFDIDTDVVPLDVSSITTLGKFVIRNINTTGKTQYPNVSHYYEFEVDGGTGLTSSFVIGTDTYPVTWSVSNEQTSLNFISANSASILTNNGLTVAVHPTDSERIIFTGYTPDAVTSSDTWLHNDLTVAPEQVDSPIFEAGKVYDMYFEALGKSEVFYWFRLREPNTPSSGGGSVPTNLQIFTSYDDALLALGSGKQFLYDEKNTNGVVSPNNSVIGLTQ